MLRTNRMPELTWISVIADREIWHDALSTPVRETQPRRCAVRCVTSYTFRIDLPHNLCEMTPFVECIEVGFAAIVGVGIHLGVVETIADEQTHLGRKISSSNILAIAISIRTILNPKSKTHQCPNQAISERTTYTLCS